MFASNKRVKPDSIFFAAIKVTPVRYIHLDQPGVAAVSLLLN
jgi:hypothetical protein